MPNVVLKTFDGEFPVDQEVAFCSLRIKAMCQDLVAGKEDPKILQLANVDATILKMVVVWATRYTESQKAMEPSTNEFKEWEKHFLMLDQGELIKLMLAANYLDIKDLLDVTSLSVANLVKGKTANEIREAFKIPNSFTAEEEEQIEKENELMK